MSVTKRFETQESTEIFKKFGHYVLILFEIKVKIGNYNLLTYSIKYELKEDKKKLNLK
jgi:hypothetical protein